MVEFKIPKEISRVTESLEKAGFEAYLVGGCVRDLFIGNNPKDWDVTTNANPEQIQAVFGEEKSFYENDFGTVGVKTASKDEELKVVEVTPYRIEGAYRDARRPESVQFSKKLEDDLKRRDFTINSIAYSVSRATIVDLYDGQSDIKSGVIRTVGDPNKRFSEDALRMMRAIRLSAELGFAIDANTVAGIADNKSLLSKVSRERVRDEFMRIINSPNPLQAFAIAQKTGLLWYIIPELKECVGCLQGGAHSFDVFEHLLRSLQHAADKKYSTEVRLAALLHDIGKPKTRRGPVPGSNGKYTFYGHEVIGAHMVKKILKDMRFASETANKVEILVRWHMFFADPDKITLKAVRRMLARVGKDNIWDLLNLRICDRIGTGRPKEQPFRFRKYKSMVEEALRSPVSVEQLKINGKDIMKITGESPGKRIGWMLHALLNEVLDNPDKNTEDELKTMVKQLSSLSDEELGVLGKKGREKKLNKNNDEISELRKKYNVL